MQKLVKTYIVLVGIVFLLTGCTVDYNLNIDDSFIKEDISFVERNTNTFDIIRPYGTFWMDNISYRELMNEYMKMDVAATNDNLHFYNKNLITDNGLGLHLKYNFAIDDYGLNKVVYNCYKYFNVDNENGIYTISTSKAFLCFNEDNPLLEQVNVNIKTKYQVLENNANVVNGDTYSWIINKENADDSQIFIKFQTKNNRGLDNIISEDNQFLILILGVIGIVSIVVVTYIYLKGKKNNKI